MLLVSDELCVPFGLSADLFGYELNSDRLRNYTFYKVRDNQNTQNTGAIL